MRTNLFQCRSGYIGTIYLFCNQSKNPGHLHMDNRRNTIFPTTFGSHSLNGQGTMVSQFGQGSQCVRFNSPRAEDHKGEELLYSQLFLGTHIQSVILIKGSLGPTLGGDIARNNHNITKLQARFSNSSPGGPTISHPVP